MTLDQSTIQPEKQLELDVEALCVNVRSFASYIEHHHAAWKEGRMDKVQLEKALVDELAKLRAEIDEETILAIQRVIRKAPDRSSSAGLEAFFRNLLAA